MTPNDVAALTALASIVKQVGTWPLVTIMVFIVIGPWIAAFLFNSRQEKRHAAVVQMYADNAALVKSYEQVTIRMEKREDTLIDLVRLNTEAQTSLLKWLQTKPTCHALLTGKGRQ